MKRSIANWGRVGVSLLALGALGLAAPAIAEEPVIDEVLAILKDRGLVDEAKYNELVARNDAYEANHDSLLGRIEWSGDFRGRVENFWYDQDDLGIDRDNRTRLRYRLRVGGKARINDWITAHFRFASGDRIDLAAGDRRSTNRTLGSNNDFNHDDLFIDRAYLEIAAPQEFVPGDGSLALLFGKQPNVFRWKIGKDYMLWDGDINPEGVGVQYAVNPFEGTDFFVNAGYYIADENSTDSDPHVIGIQGGVNQVVSDTVEVGGRLSWYNWRSVDNGFLLRSAVSGTVDGLDDSQGIETIEVAAYMRFTGIEDWPILVFGHYAQNLSATEVFPGAGDEDTAWGLGLEVGDKKKYLTLGAGYYHVEANFWPAQFTDSDLFDGNTNRRGWTVYGVRQILPNTELAMTLFMSEDLNTRLPPFAVSTALAERVRLQTDLVVKF